MPAAPPVVSWDEFQRLRPDLAEAGRRLLYQFGVGLAFLATVRPDGVPRLHPMCPLLTGDALVGFLHPSPKRQDLHRDGRYALHCFPADDNEDAFMVSGRAVAVADPARREAATAQFLAERRLEAPPPGFETDELFEFRLERCLCGHRPAATATGTPATPSGGPPDPWARGRSAADARPDPPHRVRTAPLTRRILAG